MTSVNWSRASWVASAAARALAASLFMGLAFGCLGFLGRAQPAPDWRLVVEYDAERFALQFGLQCQFLWALAAFMSELAVLTIGWLRPGRRTEEVWLPVAWAILGVALFYPQAEHGPRETLLGSGAALAGLVGGALFLWMREASVQSLAPVNASASWLWYGMIIVASATFLGGFRAWCAPSPHLQRLLDYRANRWSARPESKIQVPPANAEDPADVPGAFLVPPPDQRGI